MGNDRRTYSPAPPLRIDLRTQENVYTGVAEANYFWRAKLNQSFSWSQPLRELIDDAAYSRVQILVEIYGHVENPNTPNEKRPYMQKIATPVVFGKGQLSAALDATIARFKVSKKVTDAPGYVASGNIIVLTHAIVKLAYTREAEGGALSRANMIEITTSTGERFIAANPPTTASAYAKNVPNACLFRCLHHAIAGKKGKDWFKSLGPVRNLKSSIGINNEAYVPVSKAFEFCDRNGIELKLKIYDGSTLTDHVSPRHDTTRYKYLDIKLVLHVPLNHYMVYFQGRIAKDPNFKGGRQSVCDRCATPIDIKDAAAHYRAHDIADAETSHFEITEVTPQREDGEDLESYGVRYRDHFVNLMTAFVEDERTKSILWFAGPGGCGKSHVIKAFIDAREDLTVQCLSHTGVAAQNIGGRTIESYISAITKKKDKSTIVLPDVVIIDEISMTSMRQFERLNDAFCELNPEHNLFGGVKVVVMGDFCQLEVISTSKQPEHSVLQSPIFLRYVVAVPMLYGFRYKDDPEFYDFLSRMRENKVDFESFKRQQWKFCTRRQLAEDFTPEERPVFMAHTNAVVNDTGKLIQEYDINHSGRTVCKVPYDIYEICASDTGLPIPARLNLSSIFFRRMEDATMKRVSTKMWQLFTKALVSDNVGPNASWAQDTDCQINTTVDEFYVGQKLMVTKNYSDKDSELMNGQEVTFVRVEDDFLIVKDKSDTERSISRIWRGAFIDGKGYIAHGYPIQVASAFTGHKAQGKTFATAAIMIPERAGIPVSHLYYVMLSRCVSSANLYFIFKEDLEGDYNYMVQTAYDRLFGSGGRTPLVCYNKIATEMMEFTKRALPLSEYGRDLEYADPEVMNVKMFPANSKLKKWEPTLPAPLGKSAYKDAMLFNDIIVYDIETGAADESVRHPDFFDAAGNYISSSNSDRLTMTEWMISFYHIVNGRPVNLLHHHEPTLREFSKYQQPDGQVIFHRGEFEEDPSTDKWCSQMFFKYLMSYAAVKERSMLTQKQRKRKKQQRYIRPARIDNVPCYLVGFNIDSFDTKSIMQRLTDMPWPDGFFPFIIPNSGTAITQLQICKMIKVGEERSIKQPFIVTHDVFRLLGCIGSLDAMHKSYVRAGYTREQFLELVKSQTSDRSLQQLLMEAYDIGKGDLPHLLTQREGYKETLSKQVKTYRLEDYPEKDRDALQDPETRTYAFFSKSRAYMKRDLLTTLALYVAVNKMVMDSIDRCCLVLNTAQQYTTTYFFHHYASKSSVNSDGSVPVTNSNITKSGEQITYFTSFYLLNGHEDRMVKEATYGGKTLPRVIEWNREQGEGEYLQLDESGMYADRLQRCQYPYGRHRYSVSEEVCGMVMQLWNETLGDPDRLRYPRNTTFPFMFICRATLKMPALCIDPGVAFKAEGDELQWGICDKEGKEEGVRTQYLTNVDLATKMAEGATLLAVTEVLFWEHFGYIFESYLEKINTIKYTSTDATQKGSAKLAANAFYGATLKTDHHTVFCILDPNKPEQEDKDCKRIDFSEVYNRSIFTNGTMAIQAKALVDPNKHASRPNYSGAFVLSHSKYKLSALVRVAHGPNFLPTTKHQAIDGLRFQCLYGDTDSLYLHSTHLRRVIEHDDRQTDPVHRLLFDQMGSGDTPLTKLGRFCDEPSNDCGCGDLVDFKAGAYGKVVRFASNAPKSYTVTYELPNGATKFKSRLKGIKTNGSRLFVDEKSTLDHLKRCRDIAFDDSTDTEDTPTPTPSKKARIDSLQHSETARRIDLFDQSTTSYSKSSELTHNAMYEAITTDELILRTRCQGTLKNFGLFPQSHEMSIGASGESKMRAPYDYTVANVQRDVCGDILTRRRRLTSEEIAFLGFSDYDANRILVPYGYNYDRSLFSLQ
jgi:hypothetical protein